MDLAAAGLNRQPFPTHGEIPGMITYDAARAGLEILENTYHAPHGLALLQGPALSGKTMLVNHFVQSLHEDCAVALVDGNGLTAMELLREILGQFGYELELQSFSELLGLVRVFALQQAAHHEAPLLVIENAHGLKPDALGAVCELADLRINVGSALKIILVSDRSLQAITSAPAMQPIARRLTYDFHLAPMTRGETRDYLHRKLRAAGSALPEYVFTEAVCDKLWNASGGWPGILDRIVLLALARAEGLPVALDDVQLAKLPQGTWEDAELALPEPLPDGRHESPKLIVTFEGKVTDSLQMNSVRVLIGRSEHNDISINNDFISRHHALLVRHGQSTFLMDLNSTNGTFVNGKRISNHVLVNNDIISVGAHRIKFCDPGARKRGKLDGDEFAETAIMQTLEDMRALLARENTELLPAAAEELLSQKP